MRSGDETVQVVMAPGWLLARVDSFGPWVGVVAFFAVQRDGEALAYVSERGRLVPATRRNHWLFHESEQPSEAELKEWWNDQIDTLRAAAAGEDREARWRKQAKERAKERDDDATAGESNG